MSVKLRPATAADADFLFDMLFESVNWPGHERFSRAEIRRKPELMHYLTEWPREGEFGFIAYHPPGHVLGAAWTRLFTAADPGYGYVADGVPELTVAVAAPHRRQGIGRQLIKALIAEATSRGYEHMSLSVENLNTATRLYEDLGFKPVGHSGDATTMAINLDSAR